MAETSIDLRRRLVKAYQAKKSGTYATTASLFGVGEATVSRVLRRFRETGDVEHKARGGNNPRRVDLDWLKKDLVANPDARLIDRIAAWKEHKGETVSMGAMWRAVRDCGWTHKKKQWSPASKTVRTSSSNGQRSSLSNAGSTRQS